MSSTRSTALERLAITLQGGLNQFYGIPTLAIGPPLALGPHKVHAHYFNYYLAMLDNSLNSSAIPDVI